MLGAVKLGETPAANIKGEVSSNSIVLAKHDVVHISKARRCKGIMAGDGSPWPLGIIRGA